MASAVLSMIGDKIGSFRDSYQEKASDAGSKAGENVSNVSTDSIDSVERSNPNDGDSQLTSTSGHDAGAYAIIHRIQEASHTAKVQSHIAALRARITLCDREMRAIKEEFGLEAYEIMERNRNIGESSGGETDAEIVEVFLQCGSEMKALYEIRKRKMTDLTKNKKEKALCITTTTAGATPIASSFEGTSNNNTQKVMVHQRRHVRHSQKDRDITKPWSQFEAKNEEGAPPAAPSSEADDPTPSPSLLQRKLSETWNQAKESYKTLSQRSELKSDLAYIDKEITQRKQQFGIDLFDVMFAIDMASNDDNGKDHGGKKHWEPRDIFMKDLYKVTKEKVFVPYEKREIAIREIDDLEENGYVLVTEDEVKEYVLSHPTMYAMLQVNTGIPEDECKHVAVRVAKDLIAQKHYHGTHHRHSLEGEDEKGPQDGSSGLGLRQQETIESGGANVCESNEGKSGEEGLADRNEHDPNQMTKEQFMSFIKNYVDNPKGAQEFFHRCVFAAFDKDENGVLDKEEVDVFLNTFYKSGSIFQGDVRLPTKEELVEMINKEMKDDPDRTFSFDEIRNVMCGTTDCDRRISVVRPSWTESMMQNLKATKEALEEFYEGSEHEGEDAVSKNEDGEGKEENNEKLVEK